MAAEQLALILTSPRTPSRTREKTTGNLSISWRTHSHIACILVIGTGIGLFVTGPKCVWNEWEKIGPDAADDCKDVVSLALQAKFSKEHWYNLCKARGMPEAREIMFFPPHHGDEHARDRRVQGHFEHGDIFR